MASQKDPATVAQKWSKNLAGSTASITAGVQAVTVAPTQKAAANLSQYLAGVQNAVSSGKMARRLQAVSLSDWQQAMLNKGVNRVAAGATAAVPKMQAFMQKWLPYQQQLQQKLASMPRGDLQTNIQRAVTAIEFNAAFKGQ